MMLSYEREDTLRALSAALIVLYNKNRVECFIKTVISLFSDLVDGWDIYRPL